MGRNCGTSVADLYGAEHLLRLLSVLPVLMEPTLASLANSNQQNRKSRLEHTRFMGVVAQLMAFLNQDDVYGELLR